MRVRLHALCATLTGLTLAFKAAATSFVLPTPNRAIFQPGAESRYYAPTAAGSWTAGTFGCVRSGGSQFHEGIDIIVTQRDRDGEPTDPIKAVADGEVAYACRNPSLSNYGLYLILRHQLDGLEIYSLYSHLREIRRDLGPGVPVKAGETLAVMGRTANTRERIAPERAHLHFEFNLLITDRFPQWSKREYPGLKNEHGIWNGRNLVGLDPRWVFWAQRQMGDRFNMLRFVKSQTELCRVQVRRTGFPWTKRYAALAERNPVADKEGIAGYEVTLNFNGVPFRLVPRAASEMKGREKYRVLAVNEKEFHKQGCRDLLQRQGGSWQLDRNGTLLLDLLTH